MPIEDSPAFQFYVKEWRSSRAVMRMSFAQRGMYLEMLLEQWENLSLPDSAEAIAEIVGGSAYEWSRNWDTLRRRFVSGEIGRIYNVRLEKERQKQKSRGKRASDKGKAGAIARWQKNGTGIAQPSTPDSKGIPENSFPIAIPIPIASPTSKQASAGAELDLTERAGRLRQDTYPRLYAQYRNGAKLRLMANSLEFQDALSLVAQWDDARLEKLAALVLTTDDPWIAGTDRSFRVFAMKSSWADDRLAAWEKEQAS